MTFISSRLVEPVECPKCGKHTIVKQDEHHYRCLNCSFEKDLTPAALSTNLRVVQDGTTLSLLDHRSQPEPHPVLFIALAVLFGLFFI
ncbi:MAG: hypothetical protein AAFZ80_01835 [Cyanobacteria bacterium P01_A01_bin.105]